MAEATGEGEAEAVRDHGLVGFGDVAEAEADGFFAAIGGSRRQHDVAAFELRDLVQQRAGGVA